MEKLKELQGDIDEFTVIVEDFRTSLSNKEVDRSGKKNISRDIVELNSTINQLDVIDIYRIILTFDLFNIYVYAYLGG